MAQEKTSKKKTNKVSDAKRHGIQAVWAFLTNSHVSGFVTGKIYTGKLKNVCVPGLNCYSCPGAVGACPIGSLQAVVGSWNFKMAYYVVGFLIFIGAIFGRLICGFLCPFGLIQDLLNKIPFPKKIRTFKGDKKLKKELEKTKTALTDMAEFQQMSAFDQPIDMVQQDGDNVGKFEMTGIDKKTYTEDMFSEYDLTLVNVFTTWCSPCVNEIPELEKLYQELKDQGVGVTGVVLDTADSEGNQDEQAIKKAELLQEKTKATYPFLIPDKNMMNGRLQGISAFPETFFVDKNGNIVGETYSGSHTLEEWKEIVEKELSAIKENN